MGVRTVSINSRIINIIITINITLEMELEPPLRGARY